MIDPALTSLAFRTGSLQGLPELQVLIQDTVTATIKGIRGIVTAHIDSTIESGQLPVVRDMVSKLLTEEVLRVTEKSAYSLSQEQIGVLEMSQKKLSEDLEHVQESWNQQFSSFKTETDAMEERCRQQREAHQVLVNRVAEVEGNLERLSALETRMYEKHTQISELRHGSEKLWNELHHIRKSAVEFEQRCHRMYAPLEKMEKMRQDVTARAQHREQLVQESFEASLSKYVLSIDLQKMLVDLEQRVGDIFQQERIVREDKFRNVWEATNITRSTLLEDYPTKATFIEEREEDTKRHREKQLEFSAQVMDLQSKHDEQAKMLQDLLSLRTLREQMMETFEQSRLEVDEQSTELRNLLDSCNESISSHWKEFKSVTSQLAQFQQHIENLQNASAHMKEEVANDRMRAAATFSQQQHNRKELNYLIHRIEEIDEIKADVKVQQTGIVDNAELLDSLQNQVSQWADATAAQQELRREAASLRNDVDSMRGEIAKLADDQRLSTVDLRALHSSWLTGNVAAVSA